MINVRLHSNKAVSRYLFLLIDLYFQGCEFATIFYGTEHDFSINYTFLNKKRVAIQTSYIFVLKIKISIELLKCT